MNFFLFCFDLNVLVALGLSGADTTLRDSNRSFGGGRPAGVAKARGHAALVAELQVRHTHEMK